MMWLPALIAGPVGPVGAEEPAAAPDVDLNDLLRLPSGLDLDYGSERKGGATAEIWRKRFRDSRQNLARARSDLRESLDAMSEMGSDGSWKVAPPGLGQLAGNKNQQQSNPTGSDTTQSGQGGAPLDYGLSGDIARQRAEVERAERALRDLEVEANLASVPEEWRH
jgi:hypothetical protein